MSATTWELLVFVAGRLFDGALGVLLGGTLFAGLFRGAWARIHGRDRTERVRGWVVGLLVAHGLWVAAWVAPSEGLRALTPIVTWGSCALGMWIGLRAPEEVGPPVEPASARRDVDGLRVDLVRRPAWPALGLFALALGSFVPAAILAWFWARAVRPTQPVWIRSDRVEGGPPAARWSLPLAGLRVDDGVAWDGTPILVLRSGGREVALPVGGHPPEELRWWVDTLEALAPLASLPAPVPEAPPALRELVGAARGTPER